MDFPAVSAVWVRVYVTDLVLLYASMLIKLIAAAARSFPTFVWMAGWTGSDLSGAVRVVVVTHRSGRIPETLHTGGPAAPARGSGSSNVRGRVTTWCCCYRPVWVCGPGGRHAVSG